MAMLGRVFRALGPIDIRSVRRDPLLKWMVLIPFMYAAIVRLAVPPLTDWLVAQVGFDLTPYYPMITTYFLILSNPIMFGVVIGFLLLDERDDRTLTALQVTPMPLSMYMAYRLTVPMVLNVVMTLIAYRIAYIVPMDFGTLILVALVTSFIAPAFALMMVAFANNKVEGFAVLKGTGALALMPPIIAYLVPVPWQFLFGIVPTYWPARFYWALLESDPNAWIYALISIVSLSGVAWLMLRRFNKKVLV